MRKVLFIILFLYSQINLASNYWIVQNLATNILRVYQKECEICDSSMILEKPMIIGKNEPIDDQDSKTILGFFKIKKWLKFYVDQKEEYIPWDGRKIPKKGSKRQDWGLQGAFGVYTAILEPNVFQHLHGTIGWPSESLRFIEPLRLKNGILKINGSHGCTRVDNETIIFLRNFMPIGTPVFRIYAIESLNNSFIIKKEVLKKWTYIFYENKDLNIEFPLDYSNRHLIKEEHILEINDFLFNMNPNVFKVKEKKDWSLFELHGNPYEIKTNEMSGTFFIDLGLVSKDYKNPKKLKENSNKYPNWFFSYY